MSNFSNGAHFVKADLHIHSYGICGSYDVTDSQMNPQNIVDTAIEKGLSVISITDHNAFLNSCSAVQYADGKDILVVPGVELSTPQGHLLLYFDTCDHLTSFMGQVTISADKVTCLTSIVECLNKAKALLGIGVLAHIDIDAGFEHTIGSFNPQLEEILKHDNLKGLEISQKTSFDWYTDSDTSEKAADRKRMVALRCETLNIELSDSLPKLMSSDAHTIDKLGKNIDNEAKLTRLKMDELTFDSFRIALLSGSSRVRIESNLPNIVPCFEDIVIEGGLLDKQSIKLSKNLTCIIGGRGTGKSTLLESIRVGSGNSSEAYVVDSEVWPNVISLSYIDENGDKHEFRREKNTETRNVIEDDNLHYCPIEWYGQGETAKTIEKSEDNPIHIIKFLNDFVDLTAINLEDQSVCDSLRNNRSEIVQLRLDIKQKADINKIKNALDSQLRQMQQDKVKELVAFHLALAKEREIRKTVIGDLKGLVKKYGEILSDQTVFEDFRNIDTTEIKIGVEEIERVKEIVEQFGKIVSSKNSELTSELKVKIDELREHLNKWKNKDNEIQTQIDAKRQELESKGIPFDLGKINKIINDSFIYSNKLKEIEQKERLLKDKLAERRSLVAKREELSSRRFLTHQAFANKISSSLKNNVDDFFVRLKYSEGLYSPTFRETISAICPWRSKAKVDAIVKAKSPVELSRLAARRDFSFMDSICDTSGIRVFSNEDKTNFLQKCIENYAYEDFESEQIDDLPNITVAKKVIDANGKKVYPNRTLYQLSMGQQQSILLAILLQSDSKKPLLIDQPEDNLDSEFIYKSIVRNLRRIKEHRQVIIVTHNANIAVLGDAELIVPLKSTSSRTVVMSSGSIDNTETRSLCCEILEGGERAFKKRQAIYHI